MEDIEYDRFLESRDLEFEKSELAGYLDNGILREVFRYAYDKGYEEGLYEE